MNLKYVCQYTFQYIITMLILLINIFSKVCFVIFLLLFYRKILIVFVIEPVSGSDVQWLQHV